MSNETRDERWEKVRAWTEPAWWVYDEEGDGYFTDIPAPTIEPHTKFVIEIEHDDKMFYQTRLYQDIKVSDEVIFQEMIATVDLNLYNHARWIKTRAYQIMKERENE